MALWILGVVFALVGLPMVWLARRVFARDRAMRDWPRVPGVITASSVTSHTRQVRDKNGFTSDTTYYLAALRYTYTVGGQQREGTELSRQGSPQSQAGAQAVVDAYPAQKVVEVLVDPADPATAYLEVHRSLGAVILCAFGGLWLALAALMVGLALFS